MNAGSTKKVALFVGRNEIATIYIRKGQSLSVVVHPDALSRARNALNHHGTIGDAFHSSNLTRFSKRSHGGKTQINYGYPVSFAAADHLREFLIAFDGSSGV